MQNPIFLKLPYASILLYVTNQFACCKKRIIACKFFFSLRGGILSMITSKLFIIHMIHQCWERAVE